MMTKDEDFTGGWKSGPVFITKNVGWDFLAENVNKREHG